MPNAGMLATIKGAKYNQFGKDVLSTQISYSLLGAIFEVDHEVQRQLDPFRRAEIRRFIIDSVKNNEPFYFSPFVFSSRKGIQEVGGGFELAPGNKLYVIDGQHRTSALSSAISHLKSEKEVAEEEEDYLNATRLGEHIERLSAYPVAMQIYLDLDQKEERQLFTDLNTERRDAHTGLLMQYDQRDEYIELTRTVATELKDMLHIEFKLSRLTAGNASVTSLTTMRRCLIALFEGVLTAKTGDPYFKNCKPKDVPTIAQKFFASWVGLFPRQMSNRRKYVTGLTGIQVALANTVYLLTREQPITHVEAIKLLGLLNKRCTWKPNDPLFAHMYNADKKRLVAHSNTTAIKKTVNAFLVVIKQERGKK